ncbi:MAG TPA: acyl-CoA synthetase [Acidimicrobiia bacterium]|jgi:fatty-acyl-CoA synthase|nr:acyl-CoA synthetase [Acidimicrobiia bacterium]
MEFNLADLFEAVADAVPDRVALIAGDRRLTYHELDERANRVAHYLRDVGVVPGQHVGIYSFNRAEWVESMLGCFKARAVPINVNYRYVVEELRYLFDNADLVALIFEAEFGPHVASVLPGVPKLTHLVQLDDGTGTVTEGLDAVDYEHALAVAPATRDDLLPRSPDDLYILYTGGTTGMPKGVMWRSEDIFFAAMGGGNYGGPGIEHPADIAKSLSATPGVSFALAPLMHGNAQWSVFVALFGGNAVTLNASRRFDADEIWDLVEREGVGVISLVGDAMARPLVDALAHRSAPPSLFALVSGGAILSPSIKQELNERAPNVAIIDAFGASETGANGAVDVTDKGPRFQMNEWTTVITDEGDVAAIGEVGLLARRGHVPVGYYKDAEKTAATFVEMRGVRWAIPGDRAVIEDDGKINVLGRGSQCINTGGEKVFPEEVEAVLKSHPDVFDAVVVGVPDERWGETVAAVIAPRAGHSVTLAAMSEHCRTALAGYKVPRRIVVVDTVERTPAGKPNYRWAKTTAVEAS